MMTSSYWFKQRLWLLLGQSLFETFTISADTDNEKVLNEFKEYLAAVN